MEGDTLTVSGIYDAATNLISGTGTPITLASGGIVTLDAVDGSFTYNPTGVIGAAELVAGETLTSTFDVQVTDGAGQTDDATVRVVIHGVNQASNDTLAATERLVTTFAPSELVGNDQHSVGAADSFVDLYAGDVTAPDVAAGVWPNRGTGGATYDGTINGGKLVATKSDFGAIGTTWENPTHGLASFDPVSADDATFEVWFKPDFSAGSRQVLFEVGGNGNGMSIVYDADANRVTCTADCGNDGNPNQQLRAETGGISYHEFNQLFVVYDRDSPGTTDSLTIYVNNDPTAAFDAMPAGVATNATGANDWAGTDAGGVGMVGGTAALDETLGQFRGRIAAVRVYDRTLSTSEMEACYNAMRHPMVSTSPSVTALGATVTLNPDGSVKYDATALSTNIPAGTVLQDTFTYTISDGVGGTTVGTVTVNVTGVGTFYAVDDAIAVDEDDGDTVFDPRANDPGANNATIELQSVVASFVADFQAGTVVGQPADFSGTNGWRYMWNAPTDWDGTVSSNGATGAFGTSADYELLKWSGTFWSADGDEDNNNGDPSGWLKLRPNGVGHPGLGSTQAGTVSNNIPRGPIAAYTVSADGVYGIANSFLTKVQAAGPDGITAVIYVNDTLIDTVKVASGATDDFDTNLGRLSSGDSVYVGVSPLSNASNDEFNWDFSIVELPSGVSTVNDTVGAVTTDGTNITYNPNGQFDKLAVGQVAFETFGYAVRDGSNVASASVTVEVSGENDAPVGFADVNATDEDSSVAGTLLGNDTDIDQGDALLGFAVDQVQGAAGNVGTASATDGGGSVTVQADGSYVYDPTGAFDFLGIGANGSDTFTYVVEDAHGLAAAVATTVTVSIAGRDDGVIATSNDYSVTSDQTLSGNVITDDTGNGADVSIDVGDQLLIQSADTNGLQGRLTIGTFGFIGTRGTITNLTDAVQTVTFDTVGGRFSDPVVFANPPTDNEIEACAVMISNVTATTFDIWLKEQPEPGSVTNDMDGAAHAAESVSWFVFEAGQYQIENGLQMEIGTVDTSAIQQDGGPATWETVNFTVAFSNAPVVFSQIQTFSGNTNEKTELLHTRLNGLATTNSFQVALEDHEGDTAPRTTAETIGWLAIEPGDGLWDGNPYEAGLTADAVVHTFHTINFAGNYASAPGFLAGMATVDGVDPSHLRSRNLNANSVQVRVGEDRFNDAEIGHTDERVAYLVVGGTGDLRAYPAGTTQGAFIYDPTEAFRSMSGETVIETFTYTLTDGNGNTDTETVTITVRGSAGTLLMVR